MDFKVFLVYPPISKAERYSSEIGNSGGDQIPLGIFCLAAYLRSRGIEVDVVDAEAELLSSEDIVARISSFNPGLVAISSTTVAFHRSLELARAVKESFSDLPTVLGGAHVTSNCSHAMGFEGFDFGVVGEGELTLFELVQALRHGNSFESISGLAWRNGPEVVVNSKRAFIEDLDELPFPAFDLIPDLGKYNPPPSNYKKLPVANIMTSRGCPSQCTFCDNSIFGTKFRKRSPGNIADEIELLVKQFGVREIAFVDDTFTVDIRQIYALFDELDRRGIHFPWTCMSRINTVDKDLLKFMRDHGCWHISFGIESGNEEVLRRIKKNITLDAVRRVIGWCSELGVKTKGFFIVGHPGDSLETIDQTTRFALELPLDDAVITINTPIPGSPQFGEVDKWGTLDVTDWSKFNYWRPVFVPKGMTQEMLIAKQQEFYRRFYFRPRILWRYFLSFFSVSGPRRLVSLVRSLPFLFKKG